MAAKDSTSLPRRARNRRSDRRPPAHSPKVEAPKPSTAVIPPLVHAAIEAERSRLMTAESILHCAVLAMDEQSPTKADAPYYQSVIDTARHMIGATIDQLDSASLRAVVEYAKSEEGMGFELTPARSVREDAAAYLH